MVTLYFPIQQPCQTYVYEGVVVLLTLRDEFTRPDVAAVAQVAVSSSTSIRRV
jgi:hypothetical protein